MDKPSDVVSQDQQIRHNLVNTAANFLLNPSVIGKPDEHKTAFLRKKGLTEAEITLAYEKAESESKSKQVHNSNVLSNPSVYPPPVAVYGRPVSFWSRLSKFSSSVIVLGVALFGAHYVYKKYIEPLLFGGICDDKSQKLEKQLQEIVTSLSQLEKNVSVLEESIKIQKVQMDKFLQNEVGEYYPTPVALRELKTEIASVKSLFLNRHQFPALPKVTPPTIPHWQLPSKENEIDTTKQNDESSQNQHSDEVNCIIKPSEEVNSEVNGSAELINETSKTSEDLEAKSIQHENVIAVNDGIPIS